MSQQQKVADFHKAFDILIADVPTAPDAFTANLRRDLIQEEFDELCLAMSDGDIVEIADALADLQYVIYGAAVSFGIPLDLCFAEVHRSNMTKIGGHKADNGKWIKPADYSPANLAPILENAARKKCGCLECIKRRGNSYVAG